MKPRHPLAALALAALLAACGGGAPEEGEASGEVLEGTISDDMLALDQVRTLPPLADPTGTGATGAGSAPDEAPGTEQDAEAEAEDEGPPAEAAD